MEACMIQDWATRVPTASLLLDAAEGSHLKRLLLQPCSAQLADNPITFLSTPEKGEAGETKEDV